MPWEVNWRIEKRVIGIRLWGELTMDELVATNAALIEHLEAGIAPVHTFSNEEKVKKLPPNLLELNRKSTFLAHPQLGWAVAYSSKMLPLAKFLTAVIIRFYHSRYRRFDTSQQAIDFLKSVDGSLEFDDNPPTSI